MKDNPKTESVAEFTARAQRLLHTALRLSRRGGEDDYTDFNRCMLHGKAQRMTWVEGLEYTIATLQSQNGAVWE